MEKISNYKVLDLVQHYNFDIVILSEETLLTWPSLKMYFYGQFTRYSTAGASYKQFNAK
jgi:hypothetical protein